MTQSGQCDEDEALAMRYSALLPTRAWVAHRANASSDPSESLYYLVERVPRQRYKSAAAGWHRERHWRAALRIRHCYRDLCESGSI